MKEPSLCFPKWLCLSDTWRPAALQYADFLFFLSPVTNGHGNGCANSMFGKPELRWDVSASRKNSTGIPCVNADPALRSPVVVLMQYHLPWTSYIHFILLSSAHTYGCTSISTHPTAALQNRSVGKQRSAPTRGAQQQHYLEHRVNTDHKPFSNHWILLPFYKMQIKKKLWNTRQ